MIQDILFYAHYILVLLFGITVSAAFSGLRFSKKMVFSVLPVFVACGLLQLLVYAQLGSEMTWKLYPLMVHLPTGLLLYFGLHKRPCTVLAAVTSAYLCCMPSKWFSLLFRSLTGSYVFSETVYIVVLLVWGYFSIRYLAPYISELYNKDTRSVLLFSSVPAVYYLFDYAMGIYTNLWTSNNRAVMEFFPFLLCITFLFFCIVYYREYEQKMDAERRDHILRITAQQQAHEINAIKKNIMETRLLRHDMRLLLNTLALSIEQDDKENSLRIISGYVSQIKSSALFRYCSNDTLNYILTDFANKCRNLEIDFHVNVEIDKLTIDEISFFSIVSNALDNALNAQKELPASERQIELMLRVSHEKLLLSVKNPYKEAPVFVDGLPQSGKIGHGYGTQSIRYITERFGGKCQFILQDNLFVLRVIL